MTLYNIVLKEKKWKLTTISVEKYYTFEPGSLSEDFPTKKFLPYKLRMQLR